MILAHNYQVPEIFYTVADIVGDSLALAMKAAETEADVIVLCGVHFMAETAKLVNPGEDRARARPEGRLFARRIHHRRRRALAARNLSGVPIVTYVNTSAEVKAESDVCVTSGNAVQIVDALGVPRVIFLPDEYLAKYVASKTDVEIIAWKGHCEVHERFTGADIRRFREDDPSLIVIAHPECPPDVLAEADYIGSTQGMVEYVGRSTSGLRRDVVARAADDRMLDGRQRRGQLSERRLRAPVQSVPAHEAQHAAEDPALAAGDGVRSHDRAGVAERARAAVERMLDFSRAASALSARTARATPSSSAPASRA